MKTFLISLFLAMYVSTSASALTTVETQKLQFALDRAATAGPSVKLGTELSVRKLHIAKCTYDFSKLGGGTTVVALKDASGSKCSLPSKAVVIGGIIDVITAPTSTGSATIAFGTGKAANDLKTATGYASYANLMDVIPVMSAATSIKMTADVNPSVTIATAALTAGKINVYIEYLLGD